MYDFRSRFLHGDVDYLYPHNSHRYADRYDTLHAPKYESEDTAVAALFATLQRMALARMHKLEFAYQLVRSDGESTREP